MKINLIHPWKVTPKRAKIIQENLKKFTITNQPLPNPRLIAAADASFRKSIVYAAVAVFTYPELKLVETQTAKTKLQFPYIPGLLAFREGPVLLRAFRKIKSDPDVIIFDGHGIAHPNRMGIATHLGILLNKPTIGCAKSKLVGKYKQPRKKRGCFSYLHLNHEIVGAVLRSQSGIKPIFISVGHKIDLTSAIKIILSCCKRYRLPEPIRFVHMKCSSL